MVQSAHRGYAVVSPDLFRTVSQLSTTAKSRVDRWDGWAYCLYGLSTIVPLDPMPVDRSSCLGPNPQGQQCAVCRVHDTEHRVQSLEEIERRTSGIKLDVMMRMAEDRSPISLPCIETTSVRSVAEGKRAWSVFPASGKRLALIRFEVAARGMGRTLEYPNG